MASVSWHGGSGRDTHGRDVFSAFPENRNMKRNLNRPHTEALMFRLWRRLKREVIQVLQFLQQINAALEVATARATQLRDLLKEIAELNGGITPAESATMTRQVQDAANRVQGMKPAE